MLRVVILVALVAACRAAQLDVVDTLRDLHNVTSLLSLLDQAGLINTLKSGGPFTILAPTDAAFAKIPSADLQALTGDSNMLQNALKYHVLNGMIYDFDLRTGEHIASINGHQVRVYTSSQGKYFFNQAEVVGTEIQASNGVIFLIDEVLNVPEGTILDILKNPDYNLTQFANLVHRVGYDRLFDSVASNGRYTLFVPSDAAFAALPASFVSRLATSITYARYLTDYHTHVGTMHASSLAKDGHIVTKYRGHLIALTHDQDTGEALLNSVGHVTLADIEAENGIVHVISHVLIPSTLAPIVG
ncbi:transforming growth factor-beta-induced protein ig-h3-like [Mya arenaria]|uniref:transforming growth factor-beta-induced protein ig-h3-like n=1 Tax=Mya arenaria TaxID=6604 RepID=UPI0022E04E65|nr:transforming growth factor-beta-induced protein ig-h3-like [Mya arenaria]